MGLDVEAVRKYIRDQEAEDARLEQLNLFHDEKPPVHSAYRRDPPSAGRGET